MMNDEDYHMQHREDGMEITLVVAVAENQVVGSKGQLPWRLSSDLKRFKADTMGKPIVMGRKTFESIGRPLPGRDNIIVTRNLDYHPEGVEVVHSFADALNLARLRLRGKGGADEICVIGGGQLFEQALPIADRIRFTRVFARPEGDVFFPEIDTERFLPVLEQDFPKTEKDDYATRYTVYERRRSVP